MATMGKTGKRPTLYVFRGKHSWMVSFHGMPEGEVTSKSPAGTSSQVPTAFSRETDIEVVLKEVKRQHPGYDVRVLNWDRPKRDFFP